jgi:hypothetical protein
MKQYTIMKTLINLIALLLITGHLAFSQEIQTVFKKGTSSGGYGAISNKFTTINGEYANLSEVYGGWYVNHRFMLGLGAAGVTNNLKVPAEFSADPSRNLSYGYGQFGLMTEYVVASNKRIHVVFDLFSGAGFTMQYPRYDWKNNNYNNDTNDQVFDENWFFVAEPGVQVEINLLKWMRFSPGISYRAAFGSNAAGLTDNSLSNVSYNATLKFGKF